MCADIEPDAQDGRRRLSAAAPPSQADCAVASAEGKDIMAVPCSGSGCSPVGVKEHKLAVEVLDSGEAADAEVWGGGGTLDRKKRRVEASWASSDSAAAGQTASKSSWF